MKKYEAPEGMVYRHLINGSICGGMILGVNSSINDYELIPEPEPEPEPEEVIEND